jgi:hypothetical protein
VYKLGHEVRLGLGVLRSHWMDHFALHLGSPLRGLANTISPNWTSTN